jgi:hypothetical protein
MFLILSHRNLCHYRTVRERHVGLDNFMVVVVSCE